LTSLYELDGSLSDGSGGYQHGRTIKGDPTFSAGPVGRAVSFDGDTQVSFGKVGAFERSDRFSMAVWLRASSNTPISAFQKIDNSETRRGYEFMFDDLELVGIQRRAAHLTIRLISRWPDDAIQIRTTTRLNLGNWYHLALNYDGSGKAAGLKLYIDGKLYKTEVVQDTLTGSIRTDAELQIGNKLTGKPFKGGIDDLRFYNRVLTDEEIQQLAIHYPIQTILSGVLKTIKDDAARVRQLLPHLRSRGALKKHLPS
jgi:hypothetical protein